MANREGQTELETSFFCCRHTLHLALRSYQLISTRIVGRVKSFWGVEIPCPPPKDYSFFFSLPFFFPLLENMRRDIYLPVKFMGEEPGGGWRCPCEYAPDFQFIRLTTRFLPYIYRVNNKKKVWKSGNLADFGNFFFNPSLAVFL